MKRLLTRRPVRILLALVAVVALAVVAAVLLLPADRVRDLALAQARERLGREVEVGEVGLSLRGGLGVRLADLVVHNPAGFGGEPLLRADGVDLKLALRPLLRREVRVHRLVLEGPLVHLVRRADGTDNFTFAAGEGDTVSGGAGGDGGAPAALSVSDFGIRGGRLDFRTVADSGDTTGVRLDDVALDLVLSDPAPGRYELTGNLAIGAVTATGAAGLPSPPAGLEFDLAWSAGDARLEIARADATVADLPVRATGTLTFADGAPDGRVDLAVSDQPLALLRPLLPAAPAERFVADDGSGRFDLEAVVALVGPAGTRPRTTGKLDARDVDLALAQPFLPAERPGRLAGRGDLAVTFADTTADPADLAWSGTATVRGASYLESGLIDDLVRLDAELGFTPHEFRVSRAKAVFGAGTVDLTGTLRDPLPYFLPPDLQGDGPVPVPHLDFALRSDRVDVDRLLPAASPTGTAEGGAVGLARRPQVPPGVEFPGLTGRGTVQADTVVYLQVPFTGVTGDVTIKDRVIDVTGVKGEVYRGRVAGGVSVDLGDLAEPRYDGRYAARGIEVNDFLARFAGLSGVVFGGCDFGGEFAARGFEPDAVRRSLTLDATALIQQGRLVTRGPVREALSRLASETGGGFDGEQTLRDLAGRVSVADGRVGVEELTTHLGGFADLSVGGSYGFDGTLDYTGSLQLSRERTAALFAGGVLAELGRILGGSRPERLVVPVSVGGLRSDPKVKIDLGAVLDDLRQSAVDEQKTQLKDEAKGKLQDLLKKWK